MTKLKAVIAVFSCSSRPIAIALTVLLVLVLLAPEDTTAAQAGRSAAPGLGCISTADLGFCNQLMKNVGLNCGLKATIKGPSPVMKTVPLKEVPHR